VEIVYQDLVFPQVEELSRGWPVVVPIGTGPLPSLLPADRIVFPRLPYGDLGPLSCSAWSSLRRSLIEVLREDGFFDVIFVPCQQPLELDPGQGIVALIPIGHTEQHGFHLPLSTDTVIADGLAQALSKVAPVVRLPVWPYGVSMHRRQYPGTLSVDPRAFESFWVEVVGRLREQGFDKVFFLNGHGGNHSFLVNVTKFCGDRWPDMFVATSFLHTSSGEAAELLLAQRDSQLMGHACELETAYMLELAPELVHLDWAVDEVDFVSTPRYGMDWISDGVIVANPPWSDDTRTGTYGAPATATAEKGRAWMKAAVAELAAQIAEVVEQQERRLARRQNGWVQGAWRAQWDQLRASPDKAR
jgi:creatinine amidohydrolase